MKRSLVLLALLACESPVAPPPPDVPDGRYALDWFEYVNACFDTTLTLTNDDPVTTTAALDVRPATDTTGTVTLDGRYRVPSPWTPSDTIALLRGPDRAVWFLVDDLLYVQGWTLPWQDWLTYVAFDVHDRDYLSGAYDGDCETLAVGFTRIGD